MDGRILLRDVIEDDLPTLFAHQQDPQAIQMAAFRSRDRDAFMAHWIKILSDATAAKKAILFDERVAGYVVGFNDGDRRAVGYWIGREYWGRGIATHALSEFLRHERARPLHAHVAKHNTGSIRVLEKCGFTVSAEAIVSDAHGDGVEELIFELRA